MAKVRQEIGNTLASLFSAMKADDKKTNNQPKSNTRKVRGPKMADKKAINNKVDPAAPKTFTEEMSKPVNTTTQRNSSPKSAIVVNKSNTIRIIRPKSEEDSYFVIEELKKQQPVYVKLNSVEKEARQKILDRIYGACHMAGYIIEQTDEQEVLIDPNYR